jgi:hypothetical protein
VNLPYACLSGRQGSQVCGKKGKPGIRLPADKFTNNFIRKIRNEFVFIHSKEFNKLIHTIILIIPPSNE